MSDIDEMEKHVVSLAVEQALLQMGTPEVEKVKSILKEEYGCTTADSIDHPEYLKIILNDLYGNLYQDIIDSIYIIIRNKKDVKIIRNFLYVLKS